MLHAYLYDYKEEEASPEIIVQSHAIFHYTRALRFCLRTLVLCCYRIALARFPHLHPDTLHALAEGLTDRGFQDDPLARPVDGLGLVENLRHCLRVGLVQDQLLAGLPEP